MEFKSVEVDEAAPGAFDDWPLVVPPLVVVVVELTTKLAKALVRREVEAPAVCDDGTGGGIELE